MITHKDWMSGTRWPLKRTAELKALDTALENYGKNPSGQNLGLLGQALSIWAEKKGLRRNGKINTERNEQIVTRLVNDVLQANDGLYGVWLSRDMELARELCDPYLTTRVIGQGLGDSEEDKEKYKKGSGQSAGALFGEIQKLRKDDNANIKPSAAMQVKPYASQDFWLRKGEAESKAAPNGGLWCDASAALIVYLLAKNPSFKSSLHIVSQGDPKHHGHWYVVANRSDNELLKYGYYFGPSNGQCNFTIDIWGAIRAEEESSVVFPAQAIYDCQHGTGEAYDHNDIKVQCRFPGKRV
jgi:hypothetical protein